jgi:branched-chain amino acid transport system permease protein
MDLQQVVNALSLGGSYALLAVGLTLTWGVLNILNFAHVQFIVWGALLALWLSDWANSALVGVTLAVVIVGVAGALLDQFPFRPVRKGGGGEYGAIVVGLALTAIFVTVANLTTDGHIYAFRRDLIPTGVVHVAGAALPIAKLMIFFAAVLAMVALAFVLKRTSLGRETRAVANDPFAAEASGIRVEARFALAQGIAAALGALSGALVAISTVSASAEGGVNLVLKGFAAMVIGGMGGAVGAAIGGFVLGFIEVLSVVYGAGRYRDAISYLSIIVVLLVAPKGITGSATSIRKRWSRRRDRKAEPLPTMARSEP